MVFSRKKKRTSDTGDTLRMRGRGASANTPGTGSISGPNPLAKRFQPEDEPDTIDLGQSARFQEQSDIETSEPGTRILAGESNKEDSSAGSSLQDPVAGFLVVVNGPGRGSVYRLGYGINSIGRDAAQRISLDHGDLRVSRETHCVVTFDPAVRKFYVQAGEGPGLTYLDNEAVLKPEELASGNHLRLGDTELRFLALCGEDFGWD